MVYTFTLFDAEQFIFPNSLFLTDESTLNLFLVHVYIIISYPYLMK